MRRLLCVIYCVILFCGYSQNHIDQFENLTTEDGLPSNEVFHVIQDHEGFLWIATNEGLSKFNGSSHKVFNVANGLPADPVYHLFLQEDNSIVGVVSTGVLFRIKNDSISLLIETDTARKYLPSKVLPYSFYEDSLGNYHIGSRSGSYTFSPNSELLNVFYPQDHTCREFHCKVINNHEVLCYNLHPLYEQEYDSILIRVNDYTIGKLETNHIRPASVYPVLVDSYLALYSWGYLLLVNLEKGTCWQKKINYYCIGIYEANDTYYVATMDEGVKAYTIDGDSLRFKEAFLEELSVSSVLGTAYGVLWFSTLENGIYKLDLKSPEKVAQAPFHENITAFEVHQGNLILGYESGKVQWNSKPDYDIFPYKIFEIRGEDEFLYISSKNLEVYEKTKGEKDSYVFLGSHSTLATAGKSVTYDENTWVSFHYSGISVWDKTTKELTEVAPGDKNDSFLRYFMLGDSCYALASSELVVAHPHALDDYRSISINKDFVLLFKFEDVLYGLSYDHQIFPIYGKHDGIDLPKIPGLASVKCALFKNDVLHVATNIGVFSWTFNDQNLRAHSLINFENLNGINKLKVIGDTIYMGSQRSIYVKSISDFEVVYPNVYLSEVLVNQTEKEVGKELRLSYLEKDVEIMLEMNSLDKPFLFYRYMLEGHDNKYLYSNEGNINYSNLSPGEYVFRVAGTTDGHNFSEELVYKISVDSPFWWKTWFILLSSVLLVFLVWVLIKVRLRFVRNKLKIQQTIMSLRSQALGAQLNPHLIFNVLNSIQGIVSEGNIEQANVYIAEFSKFMRNTLRSSRVSAVNVGQEIELLKQYIKLEKLRFDGEIEFELVVRVSEMDTKMPPLATQPLIENSIIHGLRKKKKDGGKITISFVDNDEELKIQVTDNGVGISTDQSFGDGLNITKQRLKTLSQQNDLVIKQFSNPTIIEMTIKK